MARLYGDIEDIDTDAVKEFYNSRASANVESDWSIVLLQDKENSEKRTAEDNKLFAENIDSEGKKIFEIGCGVGRWADFLHDKCDSYLGIDYSDELVDIAIESHGYDNCKFQVMSAFDIKIDELLVEPPFDIILISQMLMYLNDGDIDNLITEVKKIVSEDKQILVIEPISHLETRLTLKDFYSDELDTNYNAVYRTEKEYMEFFDNFDYNDISTCDMFEDSNKRSETGYRAFIMK